MFRYTFLLLLLITIRVYGQQILNEEENVTDSISLYWFIDEEMVEEPSYGVFNFLDNELIKHNVETPDEQKIDISDFYMPCKHNIVTSSYGYRRKFKRNHYGTDLKVYIGDTIYSAFGGIVTLVNFDKYGYGKYVKIRHANGLETLYAHMSKHLVKKNHMVGAGEPIGLGGNTGRSTGSHLHFEVRLSGKHLNPEELFSFKEGKPLSKHISIKDGKIVKNEMVEDETEEIETPKEILHKVKRGENLYVIAKKYGTTVGKLKKMNNLKKNTLFIGQILRCP